MTSMSGAGQKDDGADDVTLGDGVADQHLREPALLASPSIETPDRSMSRSPLSQIQQEEDLFNSSSSGETETAVPHKGSRDTLRQLEHAADEELEDEEDESGPSPATPQRPVLAGARPQTPSDGPSTPDDTPSRRGSVASSPGSASQLSIARQRRPAALQPFDRRFSSPLGLNKSQRPSSPAFLASHSRQSSLASLGIGDNSSVTSADSQAPWEVVRWLRLRKLTGTAFSEVGKRNYGRPTCLAVANAIVVGTSKGLILVFDYSQNLLATVGLGTKAVESGAVSSLAISADHSTIAGGHASGHIFTWEVARPAKPFLHIPPLPAKSLDSRTGDGHVQDKSILHLGFLGTRHTALVSADEAGMAFSHLATRGLGAVGRVVKTVRLLGRYPQPMTADERPRKPSSVLAFAPLPLGNVEQPTDTLGLTALLTPYLLVIVSTTPIAQTQHKSSRPKDVEPHSTLSGCLAWFPAVKLKTPNEQRQPLSKTKLAYSWANVLTILDVEASFPPDEDRPPDYNFRPRARWKHDEAIVALQWLSRSVLGVLTISQRLVILEDNNRLRATDSYDLIHKQIYHQDLFSQQLRSVVEQLNEEDASMHGVVADAFYMSFRAYKGRLFLLGFDSVEIGTLSNWADRLVALMEEGSYITALELATAYYNGDTSKLTVGLPDDAVSRHNIVRERLLEMIVASLKFSFTKQTQGINGHSSNSSTIQLASACFAACTSMDELDFLFVEVFERFAEMSHEDIFFETLEPYILDERITSIPPDVLQALVTQYTSSDRATRLQNMICRLDPSTLDIDNSIILCKQYQLFDALIHIYNRALQDFVSPVVEILKLLDLFKDDDIPPQYEDSTSKLFPYLAYCLTGRYFPGSELMDDTVSERAKDDLYRFIFSGRALEWPPGSNERFLEAESGSYPYLRTILAHDTSSFLSVANEAFEDAFLNGPSDMPNGGLTNGATANKHPSNPNLPTRQTIISILMNVMDDSFGAEDKIYLNMFIARNLPKFPQYVMLPGSALHDVLEGLCHYPSDDVATDCQLSVEYLLSQYRPSDMGALIPLFWEARFYRVLRTFYRAERDYAKLLEASFVDPTESEMVLENVSDCLRLSASMTSKQQHDCETVILEHARDLVAIDASRAAQILASYAPDVFEKVFNAIEDDSHLQYVMLQTILGPEKAGSTPLQKEDTEQPTLRRFEEHYVRLMCNFDPSHVADYVSLLHSGDLRLDSVLPTIEESGAIDAAIVLMARDGLVERAMARLVKHLDTLQVALTSLIRQQSTKSTDPDASQAMNDLLDETAKYAKVGIWLCQTQTKAYAIERPPLSHRRITSSAIAVGEQDLKRDERLWLDLIDAVASITRDVNNAVSTALPATSDDATGQNSDATHIVDSMRSVVQQTFSALLASTTSFTQQSQAATSAVDTSVTPQRGPATSSAHTTQGSLHASDLPSWRPALERSQDSQAPKNPSFLRILRCFLTRASTRLPTLSDLRAVLTDIFAAYTFEATILELSNQFLDKDVFVNVQEGYHRRLRGWRPKGSACEICAKKVLGPGAGGAVFDAWEKKRDELEEERQAGARMSAAMGTSATATETGDGGGRRESIGKGKGKGKAAEEKGEAPPGIGAIVVFACGHVAHRSCLNHLRTDDKGEDGALRGFKCTVCG